MSAVTYRGKITGKAHHSQRLVEPSISVMTNVTSSSASPMTDAFKVPGACLLHSAYSVTVPMICLILFTGPQRHLDSRILCSYFAKSMLIVPFRVQWLDHRLGDSGHHEMGETSAKAYCHASISVMGRQ